MPSIGRDVRAVGPEDETYSKERVASGRIAREKLGAAGHVLVEHRRIDDLRVEPCRDDAEAGGRVDAQAVAFRRRRRGARDPDDDCRGGEERRGDRFGRAASRGQEAAGVRSCRPNAAVAFEVSAPAFASALDAMNR